MFPMKKTMKKQVFLALGLAALMLSAGCLNFTNSSSGDFPDELSSEDLDTHRSNLANASSYESSVAITITSGGGEASNINQTFRIDNADEQYYVESMSNLLGDVTTETFTNDSATWQRTSVNGGEFSYDYAEAPYNETSNDTFTQPLRPVNVTQAERGFAPLGGDTTISADGTTTYNGEQVGVYEANTEEVRTLLNETSDENLGATDGTIDDASLTVYLNEDGVLVYQNLNVSGTGEQGASFTVDATYTVSNVDNTDVTQPSWLDTARQEETTNTTTAP